MSKLIKPFQDAAKKFLEAKTAPSDSTFIEILKQGLEACELDSGYLRKKWGMSASTVKRWLEGQTVPHEALRPRIIRDLEKRSHSVK